MGNDACPSGSLVGHAMAKTPLLDNPLRGQVYLRSSNHRLPDLVVALKGQIDIELVGKIDTTKAGGLRTTFGSAPDAPVSQFILDLLGGRKGLLINSENLCSSRRKASVKLFGQNGKRLKRSITLQTACGKSAKRSERHGRTKSMLAGRERRLQR